MGYSTELLQKKLWLDAVKPFKSKDPKIRSSAMQKRNSSAPNNMKNKANKMSLDKKQKVKEKKPQDEIEKKTCPPYVLELPPSELATFDTIEEWTECFYDLQEKVEVPVQMRFIEGIFDLVEATIHLEQALFSDNPDLGYAMELVGKLKYDVWPRVDASKLQQVSKAVDVIRRACKYVGIVKETEDDDAIDFIRKLSGHVFSNIMVRFILNLI